jgi:predicted branched-subunit amino acid permease
MAAQTATFWQGAKDSQAIVLTYLPFLLPLAFLHLNLVLVHGKLFSSCSMYAGASQFLVVHFWLVVHLFG